MTPLAASPPMRWTAGRQVWEFPRPALLMGVVNVTPDSFSDGGHHATAEAAVAHALQLEREGADILDIGGESTRPGAQPVPEAEELARVLPVLTALAGRAKATLSIDTRKPAVARAALAAGAGIVNDIAASQESRAMADLVATSGAGYVCMHMQGTPATMQAAPCYEDVTSEVAGFFEAQLKRLTRQGVRPEQVVLDVGIGFGKLLEHNLRLLARLESFRRFNRPVLLGASRKSFLGGLLGAAVEARLPGSLACAAWAVMQGVQILRVHDVGATRDAVRVVEALQIRSEC
jgi:dihydropteroate synthase